MRMRFFKSVDRSLVLQKLHCGTRLSSADKLYGGVVFQEATINKRVGGKNRPESWAGQLQEYK